MLQFLIFSAQNCKISTFFRPMQNNHASKKRTQGETDRRGQEFLLVGIGTNELPEKGGENATPIH